MSKVVVIGSSNVDLIMQVDHLPQPGETVPGGVFSQVFGGKGANQAVGAARSGGDVTFVTCLGDDGFAPNIVRNFEESSIDTEFVFKTDAAPTGTALIMIDAKGENCITVAPGANGQLAASHIDQAESALSDAAMVVLQCEISPGSIRYSIDQSAALGKPILLNLAPPHALEPNYLEKLDYLVVNETEAAFLTEKPVNHIDEARAALESLIEITRGCVILTLGTQGSLVAHGDLREHVAAFKVDAVDTTAAGDVFCGSLATALVEGQELLEAVRFASAAAAVSVTRLGAQPSAPSREDVEAMLRS